ncbi:ATP-binding protein [Methylobacterium sp. J-026]|uniref:AlbA family DNA-binding domain-containing protein n=1 Tax=Methylobacterium sp. J-026 TaxID=2836624 RepID=UPI001FB8CF31|nr:ATP-binding protein [Methylobacterium sp. J-026]MCJ2136197.1 ATP-binding protein [Methylobacterium sp. J-026]
MSKPINAITKGDLDALVAAKARETNELEFKGALPFKPTKGQPETADRWIVKGDRVGDLARDEILAELVAFANADGGTLVLGLHETKGEPRVADRLETLPHCEALALRLVDAAEDVVEPRLPLLMAQGVVADATGAGYVVLRAAKSHNGPHRLRTTREFYVRRGERAAKMDVREIKDLTLSLARFGDSIERMFAEREAASDAWWQRTQAISTAGNKAPIQVRATAVPLVAHQVAYLTSRPELWWRGQPFKITIDGQEMRSTYPSLDYAQDPKPRLRSLTLAPDSQERQRFFHRVLRSDGLIEFFLSHARYEKGGSDYGSDIYFDWIAQLIAGTLCQIEHLRKHTGSDNLPYGIELELRGLNGCRVFLYGENKFATHGATDAEYKTLLPRLTVGSRSEFDTLLSTFLLDISNACGRHWQNAVTAPWDALLPRGA